MSKYVLDDLLKLTHTSTEFDCIPRSYQVKRFIEFLTSKKIFSFSCKEISELFVKANMKSPRSDRKIRCSENQVKKYIEMLIRQGVLNLEKVSETEYKKSEDN